eukprot:m.1584313 g.1584313  ORF g.1584313 m.1584313 type:complete len:56 (+) comp25320_c0_seq49:70-237(+)
MRCTAVRFFFSPATIVRSMLTVEKDVAGRKVDANRATHEVHLNLSKEYFVTMKSD